MKVKSILASLAVALLLLAFSTPADDREKEEDRIKDAGKVMTEILNVPDDVPQDLLDKADCVVVFPSVLKAAFIVGASYGRGVMTCRTGPDFTGPWGAPSMMALEGGSFGLQIGGEATDFVLLVMNDRGANGILSSKVKLGGDASVAAGPVGRRRRHRHRLPRRAHGNRFLRPASRCARRQTQRRRSRPLARVLLLRAGGGSDRR